MAAYSWIIVKENTSDSRPQSRSFARMLQTMCRRPSRGNRWRPARQATSGLDRSGRVVADHLQVAAPREVPERFGELEDRVGLALSQVRQPLARIGQAETDAEDLAGRVAARVDLVLGFLRGELQ
ncbi:hypothetical protein GCM10010095_82700 [Streptomyces anthocyanicus]|nr:hypothetical protein GCM10010095_82700 [Streptomyces anthocyanicus]